MLACYYIFPVAVLLCMHSLEIKGMEFFKRATEEKPRAKKMWACLRTVSKNSFPEQFLKIVLDVL